MINVVVFGAANVGKSTLVGYIYYKINMDEKMFEKKQQKIKEDIGSDYVDDEALRYLVDTMRSERIKQDIKTQGSSKRLHYVAVKEDKPFQVIDTPGIQHKQKSKAKGLFEGDVGIYVIEITEIIKLLENNNAQFEELLEQEFLVWLRLKPRYGATIVVFSKMDHNICNFSHTQYEQAKDAFLNFFNSRGINDVPVIPISIDLKNRTDHNLFTISNKMTWYSGYPLFDVIKLIVSNNNSRSDVIQDAFVCIDDTFPNVPGIGRTYRGKLLYGSIRQGDIVKLAPVKVDQQDSVLTAKIKSMHKKSLNHNELITVPEEGDIIGFKFSDLRYNDKPYQGEIKLSRKKEWLLCAFGQKVIANAGNVIRLIVSKDLFEDIEMSAAKGKLELLWFGLQLNVNLLSHYSRAEKHAIIIKLPNTVIFPVASSYNDSLISYKRIVLRLLNNHWVTAEMDKIGVIRDIDIIVKQGDCFDEVLSAVTQTVRQWMVKQNNKSISYMLTERGCKVVFNGDHSLIPLISKVNKEIIKGCWDRDYVDMKVAIKAISY